MGSELAYKCTYLLITELLWAACKLITTLSANYGNNWANENGNWKCVLRFVAAVCSLCKCGLNLS